MTASSELIKMRASQPSVLLALVMKKRLRTQRADGKNREA